MENELKNLKLKIDQLIETQKLILEKLNQSTILIKEPIPLKNIKKTTRNKQVDEYYLILKNGLRLKEKFNLANTPQSNRILAYLHSNDPKVFDGLKRNKN